MPDVKINLTDKTLEMCKTFAHVQHDYFDDKTSVEDYIINAIEDKLFRDIAEIAPHVDAFRAFFQDYPGEEKLYSQEEWDIIKRERQAE